MVFNILRAFEYKRLDRYSWALTFGFLQKASSAHKSLVDLSFEHQMEAAPYMAFCLESLSALVE